MSFVPFLATRKVLKNTRPFPALKLTRIGELGLLAEEGMAVVGHASRVAAPERCGRMSRWDDRRYGDTSLAFFSVASEETET